MTKNIKKSNKFLLSFVKPQKPISTLTLSRWCVSTLQQADVDSVQIPFNPISLNLKLSAKRLIHQKK